MNDPARSRDSRLQIAAELVPPGSRVADIGSDHGRLPRWLLLSGRALHCIATERDPERMRGIGAIGHPHRLAVRFETRCGEGLAPLRPADAIDVITITGLGGRSIVRILERGVDAVQPRRLVLQPQNAVTEVRRWLLARGWDLVDERLTRARGRFYVALAAERGDTPPSTHHGLQHDDLLAAGPCLLRRGGPLVRRLWENQAVRLRRIVRRHPPGAHEARARYEQARRILAALDSE